MELSLEIEGAGSVAETAELRTWLRNARIRDVEKITQEEQPPKPGEQGPALLAIMTVVLGSKAVVALIQSIHKYIAAKTPKTKIKIKVGKKLVEIDCSNAPPLPELVAQAKALLAE
jgi:hypothetical protein